MSSDKRFPLILRQMAARVAHEIRNPLSAIKSSAEILRAECKGDPELKELAEIIASEAERLEQIARGLLDLARPFRPRPADFDLNQLIEDSLLLLSTDPRAKGLKLVKELDPQLPHLRGDPEQLRQVISNLVVNALEAMGGAGTLTVSTKRLAPTSPKEILLEVRDTGPGIPPATLPHLFEPFFTTKKGGVGLGLAICARIVEAHGGKIEVESSPGKGAVFRVNLPVVCCKEDE